MSEIQINLDEQAELTDIGFRKAGAPHLINFQMCSKFGGAAPRANPAPTSSAVPFFIKFYYS